MSYNDPFSNQYGSGSSGQPYMGQSPQYSPPDSFSIPLVPGNPYFRRRVNRRRSPRLGCLITLVVLAGLAFACYSTFAHSWAIFGPTTINVSAHPTLIINSSRYEKIDLPTIYVHTGTDANKMIFSTVSPGNIDFLWNFGIDGFQQNSDASVAILNGDPVGGRRLDVTVPANTDLKINTNSANITVTGVTGQMTLTANDGTITLTHCNVQGTSLLNDNSGAINVTQSTLNGQITLNNNSGDITFNSAIDPAGSYTIQNNQGAIDATLPQNAAFHVDAKSINGSVTSDYPGLQAQNKEIHADMGNAPRATLLLNSDNGTIALHQQKGA